MKSYDGTVYKTYKSHPAGTTATQYRSVTGKEGFSVVLIPVILGFIFIGPIFSVSITLNDPLVTSFINKVIPFMYVLVGLGLLLRDKSAHNFALLLSKIHVGLFVLLGALFLYHSGNLTIIDKTGYISTLEGIKEVVLFAITVIWPIASIKILKRPNVKRNFGLNAWE